MEVEEPSQRNKRVDVRNVHGIRVFKGPRQESEMRGGRKRPGRFEAFFYHFESAGVREKRG